MHAKDVHVRVCFPMWEMNGVLRANVDATQRLIVATRNAAQEADGYLHFTTGRGSISQDEAAGWRQSQSVGVKGLLAQGANRFFDIFNRGVSEAISVHTRPRSSPTRRTWSDSGRRTGRRRHGDDVTGAGAIRSTIRAHGCRCCARLYSAT